MKVMKMNHLTRVAVAVSLACAIAPSFAQQYPTNQVRIVSAYPPGASADVSMRIVGEELGKLWNQPVVIDPRPGANGSLAVRALMSSPPDGHTLLLAGTGLLTVSPHLVKNLGYDPAKDFGPISLIWTAPFYFVVSADSPFKSLGEVVKFARANPTKMNYGSLFVGSPQHIAAETFASLTDTKLFAIHFKDASQLMQATISQDVTLASWNLAAISGLLKANKLRALAVLSERRDPRTPTVPTSLESGGPRMNYSSWVAVVAPQGTPPWVAEKLNADIATVLDMPSVKQRFYDLGIDPTPTALSDMRKFVDEQYRQSGILVKRIGIEPQ